MGLEVFKYRRNLYLQLGKTHYSVLKIPSGVFLICKKRRFYLISSLKRQFLVFRERLRKICHFNPYKIKGLF